MFFNGAGYGSAARRERRHVFSVGNAVITSAGSDEEPGVRQRMTGNAFEGIGAGLVRLLQGQAREGIFRWKRFNCDPGQRDTHSRFKDSLSN